jgi:hypothetical protein
LIGSTFSKGGFLKVEDLIKKWKTLFKSIISIY